MTVYQFRAELRPAATHDPTEVDALSDALMEFFVEEQGLRDVAVNATLGEGQVEIELLLTASSLRDAVDEGIRVGRRVEIRDGAGDHHAAVVGGGIVANEPDVRVDFLRADPDGFVTVRAQKLPRDVRVHDCIVVGDTDAEPRVARVVDVGEKLATLRILRGSPTRSVSAD